MNSFFTIILSFIQFFCMDSNLLNNSNFFDNNYTYLDPISEYFEEIDYDSRNSIKNLMDFIDENSVSNINPETLKEGVLAAIVNSLDDPYATLESRTLNNFVSAIDGSYSGFGFDLDVIGEIPDGTYVVSNVLENSAADEVGLMAGDRIESINGIKVYANKKLYEGALDMKDEAHEFEIIRDGKKLNFKLTSKPYNEPTISYKTINKDIYYIKINHCARDLPELLKFHLNQIKQFKFDKVIIDLRYNLGGWESSVIESISFMTDSKIVGYKKSKQGIEEIKRKDVKKILDIKPIVLISNNTASAAELFASQLREYSNATLVGSRTYGKNKSQGVFEFGNRILKFTNFYISSKNDFELKYLGIEPDIKIEEGYPQPYEDKVLKEAVNMLR